MFLMLVWVSPQEDSRLANLWLVHLLFQVLQFLMKPNAATGKWNVLMNKVFGQHILHVTKHNIYYDVHMAAHRNSSAVVAQAESSSQLVAIWKEWINLGLHACSLNVTLPTIKCPQGSHVVWAQLKVKYLHDVLHSQAAPASKQEQHYRHLRQTQRSGTRYVEK